VKAQITKALLPGFWKGFLWFDFEMTAFNLAGKLLKNCSLVVFVG
jgi:hypothetical protein